MLQNAAKIALFRSSNHPRGNDPKPTFRKASQTDAEQVSTVEPRRVEYGTSWELPEKSTHTEQATARYKGTCTTSATRTSNHLVEQQEKLFGLLKRRQWEQASAPRQNIDDL